jgi:PPIC-type PPIASE domain
MRLLKEPLLHFLVLGGLMFAAYSAIGTDHQTVQPQPIIRVTAADAEWLKGMWTRQWLRPPTDEEFSGLVIDHLKEEVFSREARALELDVGDTVVRRRLAQKMEFLLQDTIRTAQPTEADLRALYETRPDLTRIPPRVSFTQVFFQREQGDGRARASLAALSDANAEPDEQGDRLLLGDTFAEQDEQTLTNLFGAAFARAVLALPVGRWSGPIESAYGLHLVKVTEALPTPALSFPEVQLRIVDEWRRERQETANADLTKGLLRKYRLVVDPALRPFLKPLANQTEVEP